MLSVALAHPAVVKVSKKGMEAPAIAHGVLLPPSKDRVRVLLPLTVVYALKPGKEMTLITGKDSDPAWITFREGRYLTIGEQQVRLVEDMIGETRYERQQVLLAFPSRLVREITAEMPSIEPSGSLPLPGATTVVRSYQEGYILTQQPCPMAGDPLLDGFGRVVAITLIEDGNCVSTLLPEVRYPTARADIEAALEGWKVPVSDWPDVLPPMLEGLPPDLLEPRWPTPTPPQHDSLLYSKASAHAHREELELEEDQAKAWSKARKKGQKKHSHPGWYRL